MKIHQLSLFLENKPGQMIQPCRMLAEAGIGIHTLTLADTQQFGLLRLIVSDWEEGRRILEQAVGSPGCSSCSKAAASTSSTCMLLRSDARTRPC